MNEIIEMFSKIRIIPVVTIHNAEDANPLANALLEGGIPCAEITFRTSAAENVLQILSRRDDILLGAGSVLNTAQAEKAVENGARFIVSPGLNSKVVEYCVDRNIPVIPGTCTPTDFTQALEYGLTVVKFFPAEVMGGIRALKAMSAPFPMLKFIPTGGINPQNVKDYLNLPQVMACGGSWMVKADLLKEKNFEKIRYLVREAVNHL
ncbi:MAG: bifunctional 4-hydroxy-2-oxoglutarate aldolase/2-dehydro-3-deoxy-phosphogluconate aldolase [Calditrichaeota bacterium]|nr:bifunctional 4-hydroxy-2-oxoglutarate aldolase/2-dehydro-3-deoxy-phosphogluconate aldolase [Calditrichota bacterium]